MVSMVVIAEKKNSTSEKETSSFVKKSVNSNESTSLSNAFKAAKSDIEASLLMVIKVVKTNSKKRVEKAISFEVRFLYIIG